VNRVEHSGLGLRSYICSVSMYTSISYAKCLDELVSREHEECWAAAM